jgi:hypothetical protein
LDHPGVGSAAVLVNADIDDLDAGIGRALEYRNNTIRVYSANGDSVDL